LATDPAPHARFWPLSYLLSAWRTQLGWISFATALSVTWGGLWLIGLGFEKAQPVETVVGNVAVLSAPKGTTQRTLRVEITAPPRGNCIRFSQRFLHQDGPGTSTFYPLGSSISGGGFKPGDGSAVDAQTPTAKQLDFVLMLSIPASIPDGRYQYVFRSVYTCLWLGGLVQRRILFEAPPVSIRVGPQ
jgi:hypothetical protein